MADSILLDAIHFREGQPTLAVLTATLACWLIPCAHDRDRENYLAPEGDRPGGKMIRTIFCLSLVGCLWSGCAKSDPPASSLDDILAGKPSEADIAAGEAFSAKLTEEDFDHIVAIDWTTITASQVLHDPAIARALPIVTELYGASGPLSLALNGQCAQASCDQAEASIATALQTVVAKIRESPYKATSCAALGIAMTVPPTPLTIGAAGAAGFVCVRFIAEILREVMNLYDATGCALSPESVEQANAASNVFMSCEQPRMDMGPNPDLDFPSDMSTMTGGPDGSMGGGGGLCQPQGCKVVTHTYDCPIGYSPMSFPSSLGCGTIYTCISTMAPYGCWPG